MTIELIGVLTIGTTAIIAVFLGMWSVVRELQRDLTSLRVKVAGMDEKIDRGGPSSLP